jgi:phenylalanyl-tRNA synthetase beta chain
VRVPLSWLRDFAPFDQDPAQLAAALDDLGLVVEEVVVVGEGLADVVVARVTDIGAIEGADRIRRVVVEDGSDQVEVVCGAWNFEVGDLVALAPVGAVLPGGFEIGRRKMKGVVSNGMLCSGQELNLTDDAEGILVLNDVAGARPGQPLVDALGIDTDVVFDIAVEANRPDAGSMAGVARDLAAKLHLPFALPGVAALSAASGAVTAALQPSGPEVETLASVRVDDRDLCPRFTARVVTGIDVTSSPPWVSRRLALAGMRPINNVVDASNYVMLEIGQPTHPYDLDRLAGHGLIIRRAIPAETLTTLGGVVRTLGVPGPVLGDDGRDCLICDAHDSPVAIAGIVGGASSEIGPATTRVLLEAAYFDPMAVARTSKRLGLRTEASARFERGCDPAVIDIAGDRFCELLALTAGEAMRVAPGVLDVRGEVPVPLELPVRPARIGELLGAEFTGDEVAQLLEPLGIDTEPVAGGEASGEDAILRVTVPTYRPDIRPAPMGEADIAEEVARIFGYSRITRRTPSWPQPGRLTQYQRDRRRVKDIMCGVGSTEAWTSTFVTERDQIESGFEPPFVEVTNPLVEPERFLRSSMAPGLVRAVVHNSERRHPSLRLFEVGTVFYYPEDPDLEPEDGPPADTSERVSAIFAGEGDDAWTAVWAWRTIAAELRIADWVMGDRVHLGPAARVLHQYRSAALASIVTGPPDEAGLEEFPTELGVVGELDPRLVGQLGLVNPDGRPRRVGWLDLDLGALLDPERVPRRSEEAQPVSKFPSSDIDLAFVVKDAIPAGSVERTLRKAGGDLLESIELFDVYRGPSVADRARSLAFRLRFCALDRTLTDLEVGELRARSIAAVERAHRAELR